VRVVRRLFAFVPAAVVTVTLAACGGGDGEADPEADARGAVADYAVALGEGDPEEACDSLTAEAQEQVGAQIAKALKEPPGECSDVLAAVFDGSPLAPGLAPLADLSEKIRSGDLEDGEVTVVIAGNSGTVTLMREAGLEVPVERVDGEWLVSDASVLLFGVGTGG
jgi:hypothetical protein